MVSRVALGVCAVLGLAVWAHAQGFNRQPRRIPRVIQITPIELEGTITGIRPGMIMVNTPADETWSLKVPRKAEIRVNGTAEADVLRPGLFVRFTARVDKRRSRVVEKVRRLTIFSPSEEEGRMPGVFYPAQGGFAPGMPPNPAVPPNPGMPQNVSEKPKPGAKSKAAANEETFDIRARVAAFKKGTLSVYVPNKYFKSTLKVQLAEDAVIDLDLNNYAMARQGDKLSSVCFEIGPKALEALSVTIELAEPLSTSRKKPKKPKKAIVKRPPQRPPKEGGERQPFEVARDVKKDKPQPNEQPNEQPAPKEKPKPQGDRTQQIVQLLQGKPEEIQGKPGLKVSLGGGDPETFIPSKPEPAKNLRERFGPPEKILNVNGSLPLGEGGQQKEIQWQLWIYGPVKLFVDEGGTARYFRVEKKK